MTQLNVILDEETANLVRETAKARGVSISHHLNDLIQKGLMVDSQQNLQMIISQEKFVAAFKKQFEFIIETLTLTKYMTKNFGDESFEKTNNQILAKARVHAESYVAGLFEE